jgi:hypothetical protein
LGAGTAVGANDDSPAPGVEDSSPMPPAGAPSFEPLEPRLLLDAHLSDVQPVLTCGVPCPEPVVYVDLDQQDDSIQTDLSPVLTVEVSPCDETSQLASTSVPSENTAAQVGCVVVAESTSADCSGIVEDDTAGPEGPSQQDIGLVSEISSVGIRGPPGEPQGQQAIELFSVSPALFVENQGQWSDTGVRYVHDGDGVDVAMLDGGISFLITKTMSADEGDGADLSLGGAGSLPTDVSTLQADNIEALQFSASFIGANQVQPQGLELSESVSNYFVGDQTYWREAVPSYRTVAYEGLYEGIDLHIQGLRSHLKYEFHVAPGVDYHQIAVHYEGIEGLSLAEDGSLEVDLGGEWGVICDEAPYIYQEIDGQRVEVAGRFILLNGRTYSFAITGHYDPARELIIDPDLLWATYLGGSDFDYGFGIAVDASGNVFVAGGAYSNFTGGANNGETNNSFKGGSDAFVAKLTSSGVLSWATYLGGGGDDYGYGIAVDASRLRGGVYVF